MQVSVVQITSDNNPGYDITVTDELEIANEPEYRARLFLYYNGFQSYCGIFGYGITANVDNVTYDDWCSDSRPPRIDSHKFNCEIDVPLHLGENSIEFSQNALMDTESESFVTSAINPVNILIERKILTSNVLGITAYDKYVLVELDTDTIPDGTAVTISNFDLSNSHILGPNNLRICGTYLLTKEHDNVYRYDVEHYTYVDRPITIDPSGYQVSIWEVCYYGGQRVSVERESEECVKFDYRSVIESYEIPFKQNDYINLGFVNCRIIKVDGTMVYANALIPSNTYEQEYLVYYCPRTPSKAIPVNWPTIEVETETGIHSFTVVNTTSFDHTVNTRMVNPSTDTYFVNESSHINYSNSEQLVCSGGEHESIVCLQFSPNSITANDTSSATLNLFLESMTYSETTLILYQMDSTGWSSGMTYDGILAHITSIPIGAVTLHNPAMRLANDAPDIPMTDIDDCLKMVSIPIDSSIIKEWLSGNASYIPSFAIRVIGDGNPVVTFSSTNTSVYERRPYILFTGGESDIEPEPFEIQLSSASAEPGQVLRIRPVDPSIHTFGTSIFSNEVHIGNSIASISAGNPVTLDVIVPSGISGSSSVVVYKKNLSGELFPLTDGETYVYVDTARVNRSVKLAKKLTPGVIDYDIVGRSAMYNRDMGYVNMTEVTDETSLIQNVYSILLTNPGERLFSQDFGTGIEQRLFKLGSREEGLELLQECIQKIHKYEPRVFIDGDQSSCEFDNSENMYKLLIAVVLPSARTELIKLPFKNRGRMV